MCGTFLSCLRGRSEFSAHRLFNALGKRHDGGGVGKISCVLRLIENAVKKRGRQVLCDFRPQKVFELHGPVHLFPGHEFGMKPRAEKCCGRQVLVGSGRQTPVFLKFFRETIAPDAVEAVKPHAVGVDADVFQDVDKPGGEFRFLFGGKSAHIRLRDVHHLVDAVAERKGFKAFIIGIEVSEPDGFTVGLRAFRKRKRDVVAPEYAL